MSTASVLSRRHEGRGVVVSGGTSGIGFAAARRLLDEGARVWALGKRQRLQAEAGRADTTPPRRAW